MSSAFRTDLLRDHVAFVTGGGTGICAGITRAFLAHGAKAVIVSRNAERLTAAAQEHSASTGRECIAVRADVRQMPELEQAVQQTLQRFGRIDILVNGAAGNFLAPAAGLSSNGFRTVMDIDALGTFNASRAVFDGWMQAHGGCVINISATLHYAATPLQIHAAAAKAAVDSMTRTLAVEWGGLGIRVNGIAPGPIDDTEGMRRLAPAGRSAMVERIPLGRFGTIDEIAQIAVFLASDAASLIHGATVVADGGAWLSGGLGSLT
jgi:2,4-dienoyl-CoA reductase [(3E)-enoyl-CoA-producing], peroxisomal